MVRDAEDRKQQRGIASSDHELSSRRLITARHHARCSSSTISVGRPTLAAAGNHQSPTSVELWTALAGVANPELQPTRNLAPPDCALEAYSSWTSTLRKPTLATASAAASRVGSSTRSHGGAIPVQRLKVGRNAVEPFPDQPPGHPTGELDPPLTVALPDGRDLSSR